MKRRQQRAYNSAYINHARFPAGIAADVLLLRTDSHDNGKKPFESAFKAFLDAFLRIQDPLGYRIKRQLASNAAGATMDFGLLHEADGLATFGANCRACASDAGLVFHGWPHTFSKDDWLVSETDGCLVDSAGNVRAVVEVKCLQDVCPADCAADATHVPQVMLQMHAAGVHLAYLVLWTPQGAAVYLFVRDDSYLQALTSACRAFFDAAVSGRGAPHPLDLLPERRFNVLVQWTHHLAQSASRVACPHGLVWPLSHPFLPPDPRPGLP
eukprot:tig00001486_g8924.t1